MDAPSILLDLRYALRAIARRPGFAGAAVVCFALGVGANATIFGVVDTLFFRPPAHVVDPNRVVRVYITRNAPPFGSFTSSTTSYAKYVDLRDASRSFATLAAYYSEALSLGFGPDARRIVAGVTTHTFFPLLGVRPALGRFFGADEDRVGGGAHVAVLDFDFWQREFAGAPSALGKQLRFGTGAYTVIGVAPRGFTGADLDRVDVWLPIATADAELSGPNHLFSRDSYWLRIVGRLDAGVTDAQAAAEATSIYRHANQSERGGKDATVMLGPIQQARGPEVSRDAKVSLWLAAASGIVLVIACANVANLLLARAMQRKREIAVRLALGAGRARLVRQLLIESLVLALLGGGAALVLAEWLGSILQAVLLPGVAFPETLSLRVLTFTAAMALVVGVASGLAPALQATRRDLIDDLKAGVREGTFQRSALRSSLLVGQTALTVALVAGAGWFVASLRNVRALDLGMVPDRVLLVRMELEQEGFKKAEINRLYQQMREQVLTVPGVEDASLSIGHPFGWSFGGGFSVPGRDSMPQTKTGGPYIYAVTPDYFRTLGTQIRRGRRFTDGDRAGAQRVVIVNETMARLLWPGQDPIGKCGKIGRDNICSAVVGVVADARRNLLLEDVTMQYYVPLAQYLDFSSAVTALEVHTAGPPEALIAAIRRAVQATAPNLPYADVRTLASMFAWQVRPWKIGTAMFGGFAGLALVLAGLGLYSVLAYTMTQRTQEIGIRIANGAEQQQVLRLVVSQGLRLAAFGAAVGVVGALLGGRALSALLYGVSSANLLVLGGAAIAMLTVAALASYVPARRAARIDPVVALRYE